MRLAGRVTLCQGFCQYSAFQPEKADIRLYDDRRCTQATLNITAFKYCLLERSRDEVSVTRADHSCTPYPLATRDSCRIVAST